MSIEKVRAYFAQAGMEKRILEFPVSSATVELAALALNTEPCRIAKTLSFAVQDKTVLVVTAGDAKVNNGKFKAQFGVKAKMLGREEAEEKLRLLGAVVTSSVTKNTTALIVGEKPGKSKLDKAAKLNIPIITEKDFLELIKK